MPGPLVASVAGSVGSALLQTSAANKAASAQTAASNAQIAETRRQFDLIQSLMRPYVEAGGAGLRGFMDLMGIGGGNGVSAGEAQRAAVGQVEGSPLFGELAKQGEYGIMSNAAATGGLRGGNTQAALAQFRPQMLQELITHQLANFGGLATAGQNAAAGVGAQGMQAAGMVGQSLGDIGAAQAGRALAAGQAWQNAGAGVLNTLGMMAQPMQPGGGAWARWSF